MFITSCKFCHALVSPLQSIWRNCGSCTWMCKAQSVWKMWFECFCTREWKTWLLITFLLLSLTAQNFRVAIKWPYPGPHNIWTAKTVQNRPNQSCSAVISVVRGGYSRIRLHCTIKLYYKNIDTAFVNSQIILLWLQILVHIQINDWWASYVVRVFLTEKYCCFALLAGT